MIRSIDSSFIDQFIVSRTGVDDQSLKSTDARTLRLRGMFSERCSCRTTHVPLTAMFGGNLDERAPTWTAAVRRSAFHVFIVKLFKVIFFEDSAGRLQKMQSHVQARVMLHCAANQRTIHVRVMISRMFVFVYLLYHVAWSYSCRA